MSSKLTLAELYIAMLGRAPDAPGLAYWVKQFDDQLMSLRDIAFNWVEHQPEFRELYPSSVSTDEFVRLIYANILDREPDASGRKYWTQELDKGALSRDGFVLDILYALGRNPGGEDAKLLHNRAEVGVALAESGIQNKDFYSSSIRAVTDDANTLKLVQSLLQVAKAQPTTQASLNEILVEVRAMNQAGKAANKYAEIVARVAPELEKSKSAQELDTRVQALLEVARATSKNKEFIQDADLLADYLIADAAKVYTAAHHALNGFDKPISLEVALLLGKISDKYTLSKDALVLEGLSLAEATEKLKQVEGLIKGAENASSLSLSSLYSWKIQDTAAKLLANLGSNVPAVLRDAKAVSVTDSSITLEQLGKLDALTNFEVGKVQVDITVPLEFENWSKDGNAISFTLDLPSFIDYDGISLVGSGSLIANINSVSAGGSTKVQVRLNVSNGAATGKLQLKLSSKSFDISKFELKFNNVLINDKSFGPYTYSETDGSAQNLQADVPVLLHLNTVLNTDPKALPDLYSLRPDVLQESKKTVADIAAQLAKVQEAIKNAANGSKIVLADIYKWEVQDTAENILKELGKSSSLVLSGAGSIRLDASVKEVTAQDLKALKTLKNFKFDDKAIDVVATPLTLKEALALKDANNLAEPYKLTEAKYEAGTLTVAQAEALIKDADALIKGAEMEAKPAVEVLLTWSIKDTASNLIKALEKEGGTKALTEAANVETSTKLDSLTDEQREKLKDLLGLEDQNDDEGEEGQEGQEGSDDKQGSDGNPESTDGDDASSVGPQSFVAATDDALEQMMFLRALAFAEEISSEEAAYVHGDIPGDDALAEGVQPWEADYLGW